MRSTEEIYISAILSLHLSYRCINELVFIEGKNRSRHEREAHRKVMLDWLEQTHYFDLYTEAEMKIYKTKIGFRKNNAILNEYYVYETVEPLLWSIGLVDKLTAPWKFCEDAFDDTIIVGIDHCLDSVLAQCKPKELAEIELQRDMAMLWHWRAIEGDGIPAKCDVKRSLQEIFGDGIQLALERIPFSKGAYPDFLAGKKVFRNLDSDTMESIRILSRWRQHAYEWILGDDVWDEVETNT